MKSALYHIFWKNLLIVVAVVVCFCYIKDSTRPVITDPESEELLDQWIAETEGMTPEECDIYVQEKNNLVMTDQRLGAKYVNAFRELSETHQNTEKLQEYINFARNGEGVLTSAIPYKFIENLDFYKDVTPASMINDNPLSRYLNSQSGSVLLILSVLMFAVFMGQHYEAEIHRLSGVMKHGAAYHRSIRLILIAISFVLFAANEIFDLYVSGMFDHSYIFSASLQSYKAYITVSMDITIGQAILMIIAVKALTLLFFCFGAELAAKYSKSVKNAVISSAVCFMAFTFIDMTISGFTYSSLWGIRATDPKALISDSVRIPSLGVSTATLGLCFAFILTVALLVWLMVSLRTAKHKRLSLFKRVTQ